MGKCFEFWHLFWILLLIKGQYLIYRLFFCSSHSSISRPVSYWYSGEVSPEKEGNFCFTSLTKIDRTV